MMYQYDNYYSLGFMEMKKLIKSNENAIIGHTLDLYSLFLHIKANRVKNLLIF